MCVCVCVCSVHLPFVFNHTLFGIVFNIPVEKIQFVLIVIFFSFSKLSSSSSLSFCVNGSAKRQNSQEQNQPIMFESLFKMNGNLCVVVFVRRVLIPIAAADMAKW